MDPGVGGNRTAAAEALGSVHSSLCPQGLAPCPYCLHHIPPCPRTTQPTLISNSLGSNPVLSERSALSLLSDPSFPSHTGLRSEHPLCPRGEEGTLNRKLEEICCAGGGSTGISGFKKSPWKDFKRMCLCKQNNMTRPQ